MKLSVTPGQREVCGGYMTAHWVAPQQSLMMATPDLVMDGLLGGTSRICLLGFGGPCQSARKGGGQMSLSQREKSNCAAPL